MNTTSPKRSSVLDRVLVLELVRVTEAAGLAAARWMGRGDKNAADGAAVEAMRRAFDTVAISGLSTRVAAEQRIKGFIKGVFEGNLVTEGNQYLLKQREAGLTGRLNVNRLNI